MPRIEEIAHISFEKIADLLQGCLLYLDDGAGEALAADVGIDLLLNIGVVHVCALETVSRGDAEAFQLLSGRKEYPVVVITTQLLTAIHGNLIRLHQVHGRATSITVLCSCTEAAHAGQPATMLGEHAYDTYLSALKEDLAEIRRRAASKGDQTARADCSRTSVQHFPLHACSVDSASFVLPAAGSAAVSARLGTHIAGLAPPDALPGDDGLDAADATGLKLLAHSLLGLASQLGVRLDTFSLGPVSNLIGEEICAVGGPASGSETAALLLVDRSLDLVTPLSHSDHVLDQIYGSLQRRGAAGNTTVRTSDVIVPLPAHIGCTKEEMPAGNDEKAGGEQPRQTSNGTASTSGSALQGSLCAPGDAQMGQWREFLVTRRGRDAALFLRKWLREALRKAGIQTKMRFEAGSVPAEEFRALADLLAGAPPKVCFGHLGIMQLGCAAAAALDDPTAARWGRLAELEQEIVRLSANGMIEELAEVVCGAISQAGSGDADADSASVDAVGLCAYALALAGDGGAQRAGSTELLRSKMCQAFVEALLEGALKPQHLGLPASLCMRHKGNPSGDSDADEEARYEAQALRLELTDKVTELLVKLQAITAARSRLKDMQRYLEHGAGSKGVMPLLSQLTTRLLDQQPIADLQHNSASLGGLLKSGLGRFGLVQKQPQPGDHTTIIIFVVGGISVADVREVRHVVEERVSAQPGPGPINVLVGGTALLSPNAVSEALMK